MPVIKKIYLDNNILSGLVGLEHSPEDGLALQKLALSDHEFITSPLTEMEMEGCSRDDVKGAVMFIYKVFGGEKKLNKEKYYATGMGDALFGSIPFGGGETTKTPLVLLQQMLKHPMDARHVFQALSKHADYFLTLDENSILRRYRANHKNIKVFCERGGLKIMNPIELVNELGL